MTSIADQRAKVTTVVYDYENRLTTVTTGGTVAAVYTYNALGQRIGVKDSGTQTWTVYAGPSADANPYADFNGSGSMTVRYLFGPTVVNGAVTSGVLARRARAGRRPGTWPTSWARCAISSTRRATSSITSSTTASGTSSPRRTRAMGIGSSSPGCSTMRRRGSTSITRGGMERRRADLPALTPRGSARGHQPLPLCSKRRGGCDGFDRHG